MILEHTVHAVATLLEKHVGGKAETHVKTLHGLEENIKPQTEELLGLFKSLLNANHTIKLKTTEIKPKIDALSSELSQAFSKANAVRDEEQKLLGPATKTLPEKITPHATRIS